MVDDLKIPEATVKPYRGAPALFINGKPVSMLSYSELRGVSAKHHRQFAEIGTKLYEFSGQLVPSDVTGDVLFRRGISPVPYQGKRSKIGAVSMCWTGPETSDFTWLDRSLDEALEGAPEALFYFRLWIEPPGWWVEAHPEELMEYADGFKGKDPWREAWRRVSFASERWYREGGLALRRFMEHIQSSEYAPHIVGYHLSAGAHGEWHYPSSHHLPDVSEPMRKAFISFLREKYNDDVSKLRRAWNDPSITFEDVTVPMEEERLKTDLGVFRDPSRSQRIIDYYRCHHHVLAKAVLHFSRIVKEVSQGRSLVILFYGYTRDVGAIQEGGHLELKSVLESPYVDILCSPHTYRQRYAGLDGGFRALPGSIALHGKQFFDEQDEITHIFKGREVTQRTVYAGGYPPRSLYEAIQLARRQYVQALTQGVGSWWFELTPDRYDDPRIMRVFEELLRIDREALERPRGRRSEVAVFVSLETPFYTAHWKRSEHKLLDSLLNSQWSELFRMGAPFDIYDLADLPDKRFPKHYRCYIFLNAFYTSNEIREAIEDLKSGGKTLVWFYAPGAITDEIRKDRPSIIQFSENASALTDIELRLEPRPASLKVKMLQTDSPLAMGLKTDMTWGLSESFAPTVVVADPDVEVLAEADGDVQANTGGRPGWSVKRLKSWSSVHFVGPNVPSSVLRNVLREAGCHIYLESDDNLYVNESYLGIHASRAGIKTVKLPSPARIINVFDPKWPMVEGSSFTVNMKRNETMLFSIEYI